MVNQHLIFMPALTCPLQDSHRPETDTGNPYDLVEENIKIKLSGSRGPESDFEEMEVWAESLHTHTRVLPHTRPTHRAQDVTVPIMLFCGLHRGETEKGSQDGCLPQLLVITQADVFTRWEVEVGACPQQLLRWDQRLRYCKELIVGVWWCS